MKIKYWIISIFLITIIAGCSTTRTSTVVSDKYDINKDETCLTIVPYGNINIPGKWVKTQYNEISRQHFFSNQDSVSIAVTKNPQSKYPFYQSGMNNAEFIDQFFNWEKDYYEEQGFVLAKLEENTEANYIIWSAKGKNANSIFLYGAKDKFCYNFSIFESNWSEEVKIEFLRSLFERN